MRTWRKLKLHRVESRAFNRGAEEMRKKALQIFSRAANAEFNGRAVAELIRSVDAPVLT
jgi:hypothetical protein